LTLKNFCALIKEAVNILQKHKNDFNQIVPNLKLISENTLKISEEVKKSVYEAGEAVRTISHETTDTVLTINETADCLAKYARVIGEIVKTIVNMFSSNEKAVK
jgi:methyl-accepting chemotaxis protein